jgi:replicative DNA helicase
MLDQLHAQDSEAAVIGSLIADGQNQMEQCLRLRSHMFSTSNFRLVFSEMERMSGEGKEWDYLSLAQRISDRKVDLSNVTSNATYLEGLTDGTYHRMHLESHVQRIVLAWKRRRGAELCESTSGKLRDGEDTEEMLGQLQTGIFNVIAETGAQDDPLILNYGMAWWDSLEARAASPEIEMGLSYGNNRLDAWTRGMRPGEMSVVGARSGVGKSSITCQAIASVCSRGHGADFFSLEMDREEVQNRICAIDSGIEYRKIDTPQLMDMSERQHVKESAYRVSEWPLRIYEDSGMPIDEIVARARMSVRRYGSRLICVDYAQIVHGEGKDDRTRVSAVSSKLRRLAKDEGCHVMLLSQLRKVSHEHYSNPPTAGDLRETGQLENDAHIVILLHRPWDDQRMQISYAADILIPKFRRGRTGAIQSEFCAKSLTFA